MEWVPSPAQGVVYNKRSWWKVYLNVIKGGHQRTITNNMSPLSVCHFFHKQKWVSCLFRLGTSFWFTNVVYIHLPAVWWKHIKFSCNLLCFLVWTVPPTETWTFSKTALMYTLYCWFWNPFYEYTKRACGKDHQCSWHCTCLLTLIKKYLWLSVTSLGTFLCCNQVW